MKSIASAELLVAGDAVDGRKVIANAYQCLFGIEIPLHMVVDSKDLFSWFFVCRCPEDENVAADVQHMI